MDLFTQVTDACASMQQYLISRGVQYDGEPEVDITAEDGNAMTNWYDNF